MTAEQGRRAARVLLGEVAKGTDPVEEAEQQRGHTIDEICDWYLERAEAGKIIGRSRRPIKASTLAMDRSRSEEHTSELQSLMRISYAVFCLKKKKTKHIQTKAHTDRQKMHRVKHQQTKHERYEDT